ncbi:MAG: glycosyltransferase family 9 protein [Alphaproteobacteria bacterium]|nr:glycosyltransferase family 9 protein [Alphaproteobacteria bacterium]
MIAPKRRILVIKLGALGDFILATGPFSAIRAAHPHDEIVLLTTAPFAQLGRDCDLFDEVWIDERPTRINLIAIQRLRRRLRGGRFTRVYDLQTSGRSAWYFRLMRGFGRPQWSGVAFGASHPHANHNRNNMHTIERQADQLAMAGIPETPFPDLSWLTSDISRFGLPDRFALLIPGGAAHRPEKRWPAASYREIAGSISDRGVLPLVIGGPDEFDLAAEIAANGVAKSIAGDTSFADIAEMSRHAAGAVGNDTGPMHIAAICGCPSVVLFSKASNPDITAPRGDDVTILQRYNLADLGVSEVAAALTLR